MSRYVVRGKDENGRATTAAPDPAEDDRIEGHLPATDGRFSTFATIDDAEQARRDLVGWGCTDVRIYDAETGAVVPTYAEALARLEQIDAALAGAFAIVPCNNSQPRVFIRGAGVELVRHQRALADMRLPDNVADAEAILASAATALQAAIREEPSHPNRMTRDLQDYPQGAALHVVPELADEVDEHRATKEKLAEADKYIATQDEQIEALETALAARAPLTDAQVEGFAQTAMDDICKGTERPRNAVARAIRAALNAAGPGAPPLTAVGAMALWERAYRAAYAESGPGEPPPDERLAAMLAGHQAVLDAVASPAGSEARAHAMEAEIDYRVRRIVAQRAADKLAEMDALLADEPTPDPGVRPESGPMRFGDDWAGVFLRGDYAGPMGMYLRQVLGDEDVRKRHPFSQRMLDGLAATLSGCDESGALDGLQRMRPFAECVATGPRLDAQPNGAATRPRATTWPADGAGATVTEPSAPGSADPAPR